MSKFVAYYNLCAIQDVKESEISPDWEDGNIIVTFGRNMVVVMQISSQKQIRSWSVLEKLSSKVIFDPSSRRYVGVFAKRYLRFWDSTTVDVNKCKKLKFTKSIVDIVCNDTNSFVLFGDGSCQSLASAVELRKDQVEKNFTGIAVEQAKIFTILDGRRILTYFFKNSNDCSVEFVKSVIDNSGETSSKRNQIKFNLTRGDQEITIKGYTVVETQNLPMLLTIWSDGKMFGLELGDDISPESSPGILISVINSINLEQPISILGVSKNSVAVYGANSGQDGAFLLLYNTQFKVIKATQFFKIYFNNSRLFVVGSNILLAMGQNLSVVSYKTTKDLLSELVGSQISNDLQTLVKDEAINEEDALEQCIEHHCVKPFFVYTSNQSQNKKNFNADEQNFRFETTDDFNRDIKQMTNTRIHVDILEKDKTYNGFQVKLMSNYNDDGFVTQEIEHTAMHLEICGISEQEITEKLLTILIKCDLVKDIAVCLRRYNNISEKMLVKTLKYSLSSFRKTESVLPHTQKELQTSDQVDVDLISIISKNNLKELANQDIFGEKYHKAVAVKERIDLLNIVLSCSFEPDAIAMHIRKEINFDNILDILEYLHNLIIASDSFIEEHPLTLDGFDLNFELKIFRWFGIFLSTHFQKLALSKDLKVIEILQKWHDLFTLYKKEITNLEYVYASLNKILQKKKIEKDVEYSKWYTIEEVILY